MDAVKNTPENDHAPAVAFASDGDHGEDDDELDEFSDEFKCCVCLDLIYKPVVLACGHISCFWCVFEAMDTWQESRCPVCRNSYYHFPSICWLLHFVLLKLYPKVYQRRESQVIEMEKHTGTFSPQFQNYLAVSHNSKEHPLQSHAMGQDKISSIEEVSELSVSDKTSAMGIPTSSSDEVAKNVAVEENGGTGNDYDHGDGRHKQVPIGDLLCGICKQLLCRPVVLNCGHVFCEVCIISSCNESCRCPVCQSMHPNGFPKVCLVIERVLEEHVSEEYAARKVAVAELRNCQQGSSSASSTQVRQGAQCSSLSVNDCLYSPGHKVHFLVGCDCCGMYPLIGDRYSCKDCTENVGFDLCGDCHKSSSNLPGRFNQRHKPDHRFEVVEPKPIIILSSDVPEDHVPAPDVSAPPASSLDAPHDPEGPVFTNDTSEGREGVGPTS